MKNNNIVILKLGESSLGQSKNLFKNLPSIVHKLKSYQNQGLKPILVVSALSGHSRKIKKIISSIEGDDCNSLYNGLFCHGEFFSCDLLQKYCLKNKLKTKALIFEDTPVYVKKQNASWGIDYIDTKKIKQLLNNNCIPIIPGFIGKHSNGTFAAMNFDCSDITAVTLSDQFNLSSCVFLKNPGALHEGNKKIIPNSKIINQLSYSQLKTYSKLTSTIIHDEAIDLAKEKNINLILASSYDEKTTQINKNKNNHDILCLLYKEQNNSLYEISILHKQSKDLQDHILKKIFKDKNFTRFNHLLRKNHIKLFYFNDLELKQSLKFLYTDLFNKFTGVLHDQ